MQKKTNRRLPLLVSAFMLILGFYIIKAGYVYYYKAAYPLGYSELVEQYCREYNVPADLTYAVIYTESGFNPMAKSNVGARGLMQIMPDTLDWAKFRLGEKEGTSHVELHQPEVNLKYGIATLAILVEEFGDSPEALAAYHAGRGSVNKWLEDTKYSDDGKKLSNIPFADTKQYVIKINRTRQIYKNLYGI